METQENTVSKRDHSKEGITRENRVDALSDPFIKIGDLVYLYSDEYNTYCYGDGYHS